MIKVDRTNGAVHFHVYRYDFILFYFILFYKLCHNKNYIIHMTLLTITQKIRALARALIKGGGGGGGYTHIFVLCPTGFFWA